MLTKSLHILLFCFSSYICFGQTPVNDPIPEDNVTSEIGINATQFITNFIKFNDRSINSNLLSDYFFKYRSINQNSNFVYSLRAGMNVFLQNSDSDINGTEETSNSGFRVGLINSFGRQVINKKRFDLSWSIDLLTSYNQSHTEFQTSSAESDLQAFSLGTGPSLFLGFNINSYLSLSTECAFYVSYQHSKNTRKFTDFQGETEINEDTSSLISTRYLFPVNIWLNYRF